MAVCECRKLRPTRPGDGPGMGERQHRSIRRRSRPSDCVRGECRSGECWVPPDVSVQLSPLPADDLGERNPLRQLGLHDVITSASSFAHFPASRQLLTWRRRRRHVAMSTRAARRRHPAGTVDQLWLHDLAVGSNSRRSVPHRHTVQPAEDRPCPTQRVDLRREQERRNVPCALLRWHPRLHQGWAKSAKPDDISTWHRYHGFGLIDEDTGSAEATLPTEEWQRPGLQGCVWWRGRGQGSYMSRLGNGVDVLWLGFADLLL